MVLLGRNELGVAFCARSRVCMCVGGVRLLAVYLMSTGSWGLNSGPNAHKTFIPISWAVSPAPELKLVFRGY